MCSPSHLQFSANSLLLVNFCHIICDWLQNYEFSLTVMLASNLTRVCALQFANNVHINHDVFRIQGCEPLEID